MPIYEYQCDACGEKLDKLQKMNDEPLKTCPKCYKEKLKKVISTSGFRLKGTGWYETDFKNSNKSKTSENTALTKSKNEVKTL